jgi:hypothetical protein
MIVLLFFCSFVGVGKAGMGFAAGREVTRWEGRGGFSFHYLFNRPFGAVVLDKAMIL